MSIIPAATYRVRGHDYEVVRLPGGQEVLVSSRSQPGFWQLTLTGYDWECGCTQWAFRRRCSHTEAATLDQRAIWTKEG